MGINSGGCRRPGGGNGIGRSDTESRCHGGNSRTCRSNGGRGRCRTDEGTRGNGRRDCYSAGVCGRDDKLSLTSERPKEKAKKHKNNGFFHFLPPADYSSTPYSVEKPVLFHGPGTKRCHLA